MIVDSLFNSIARGKEGRNIGLKTGMPLIDSVTYGTQQGWFSVYGGDSGSGKTSLCLYTKVYRPFMEYLKSGKTLKISWLLFSFEMSGEVVLSKLLSTYLYEKYKKVLSYSDILSFSKPLSDEDYNIVLDAKNWLRELESLCTIIDKPVNAEGLYAICKEWSRSFGTYTPVGTHKEMYTLNDPQQYLIVVVDHIKLLATSPGNQIKQEIDKACDYLIYFRNKCKFCVNVVQQLNRNFKSMARRTDSNGQYSGIQLDDFSDSSGPIQAAEVVYAIFHPYREKMSKCEGYDVRQLKDRLRILSVLKNRFGLSDKGVGAVFYGENSIWRELPSPDKIINYQNYLNL